MFNNSVIDDINNFGLLLYYNIDSSSLIVSPLGISTIFTIIKSANSCCDNFNINMSDIDDINKSLDDDLFKFVTIFIFNKNDKSINKKFIDIIKKNTLVVLSNNQNHENAIDYVNNYVSQITDEHIHKIITNEILDKSSSVNMININYFRLKWLYKFDKKLTKLMTFHATNNVYMMNQKNIFNYFENSYYEAVELPLYDDNYVMGFILSKNFLDESSLDYSLNNVPNISLNELNEIFNNMQMIEIDVYIPKIIHRKNINVLPIFQKMNINHNIKTIADNAYISNIKHETILILDEDGKNTNKINIKTSKTFMANRVFIYYVRYIVNNLILLYGNYQGNY